MKTILFALDFVRQWFMDSTGSPQMPSLIRTGFGEAKPVKLDAYWNKMINTNQDFVKPRSWPE